MKTWKDRLSADENGLKPKTLTELYGNERLLMEHHSGILSYGDKCIRVGTTWGMPEVLGEDLRLCCMSRTQLVIRGKLLSVTMGEGL